MKARGYWRDESGAGAVEFAIVLIPFLALIFGIIHLSLMFYANHTLQFATEAAARCYSVNAGSCGSTTAVQAYAAGRYKGPNISPVFTALAYPDPTCFGHAVTGAGNYRINAVVTNVSVPLTAIACFP